jgi:hypothetical protein
MDLPVALRLLDLNTLFGNVGVRGIGDGLIFVNNRFRPKTEVAARCSRLDLSRRLNFCNCYSPGTGDGEPKGFG